MIHLLSAEWFKINKRWMPRVIVLIMLAIIVLIFWGVATTKNRTDLIMPRGLIVALFLASSFSAFIWPILSGSWAGNEYGWGTVRMILSRRPDRAQWSLAAMVALILYAGLALLATLLVGFVTGSVVAALTNHSEFISSGLQSNYAALVIKVFFASWLIFTYYLVLAYAAGTIFRSGAVGIGAGIGVSIAQLIVSGIFDGLGGNWRVVANHFPNRYGDALIGRLSAAGTTGDFTTIGANLPSIVTSIIGLVVYIAILVGVTLFLVKTRDVTS
ncbi:MAG: hypothetical protein ACRDFX_02870 [Chloroflexota bacterium]